MEFVSNHTGSHTGTGIGNSSNVQLANTAENSTGNIITGSVSSTGNKAANQHASPCTGANCVSVTLGGCIRKNHLAVDIDIHGLIRIHYGCFSGILRNGLNAQIYIHT